MTKNRTIANLLKVADSLPEEEKALFRRIYAVTVSEGQLRPPPSMDAWITRLFGSVEAVSQQKIVRVTNLITCEETIFNPLRELRPVKTGDPVAVDALIGEASRNDSFGQPEQKTPEDVFGRIKGKYCITASNIAKCDGWHGVVIFNRFHPLEFSRDEVVDYFEVAREWAKKVQGIDPESRYFLLVWNCLWRSGASMAHGHLQIMLSKNRHYARIEGLRRAALDYRRKYGSNYFADLFRVHQALDCGIRHSGVNILASLTPVRNNEIMLLSENLDLSLEERIYEVLFFLKERVGVSSFNLGLTCPAPGETAEDWSGFPVMARIVDRGRLELRSSDVGGLELFASGVVSSDPFQLASGLRQFLKEAENG